MTRENLRVDGQDGEVAEKGNKERSTGPRRRHEFQGGTWIDCNLPLKPTANLRRSQGNHIS